MRGFVGILESAPPTNIVDKDCPKLYVTANNVFQQSAEALPVFDDYTALSGVFVCLYDIEPMLFGYSWIRIL